MIATISIACHNRKDITQKCLESLRANTPLEGVEYILSDNCSSDGTQDLLYNFALPNKTVLSYDENLGFLIPHNEALIHAAGKFFVVLNNDIVINDPDWLINLLDPLTLDANIGLTGFANTMQTLTEQGSGNQGNFVDYIEGVCIAGHTELFRKYGLFSPAFKLAYFEDSDLSLRFVQMGYGIRQVKVKFTHDRGATAKIVDQNKLNEAKEHNKKIFLDRWGTYLRTKKFTNMVLVKCKSDGIGDIVAMTPVLEAIQRDHPTAKIFLDTNYPDLFKGNPFVHQIVSPKQQWKHRLDREIDLIPPTSAGGFNFASYELLAEQAAKKASTSLISPFPQIFLKREDLDAGHKKVQEVRGDTDKPIAALATRTHRTEWEGRSWTGEYEAQLAGLLQEAGYITVELGKKIPSTEVCDYSFVGKMGFKEYFSFIANLLGPHDCLVAIDSLPLWAGQAFGIKTFCLFGATEPIARVIDFSNVFVIRNIGLSCLGCYQRNGVSGHTKCKIGHQLCMRGLSPQLVMAYILGEINPFMSNVEYLRALARKNL